MMGDAAAESGRVPLDVADALLADWRVERPDLGVQAMAIVGQAVAVDGLGTIITGRPLSKIAASSESPKRPLASPFGRARTRRSKSLPRAAT